MAGGTLTFTGNNTYTGPTTITAGSLFINGAQPGSPVSIENGGILRGTGTTGSSGGKGTIFPGGTAPGTLSVNGAVDLTLAGGGKFSVRLNDAATPKNDHLRISGDLKLTGATLAPVFDGPFSPSTTYVIASYGEFGGGLTGTFASVPAGCSVNYAYHNGTSPKNIALTIQNPYQFWISSFGLDPLVAGVPGADPDKDGVTNGIEFMLGTDPVHTNAAADAPAIALNGPNVVFIFRRWQAAAYTNPVVQTATDLAGPWTSLSGSGGVTPDFYGPGIDRVVVTIPRAGRPRLFCRLKAAIP